jgi:2-(1,2-epoxy-1,2-dihydrophenyl)acetyl-CoA isomerase
MPTLRASTMSDLTASDAAYASVPGLVVELDGAILRLRVDRADKRNAIDDAITVAMTGALDAANSDERVRAIVLTASGEHFCAGADIVARNAPGGTRPRVGSIQRRLPSLAHRLIERILTIQVPVVAAVRGHAAGIGLHLALAADFCVAADDARLWEPFAVRGFTPDSAGTWLLPRRLGSVQARRMLLLGEPITGRRAAELGFIHESVGSEAAEATAEELASKLAAGPTVSLGLTKWLLHAGSTATLDEHLQHEAMALELSSRSEDFREGLQAFRDRRDPDFHGR